jgi:hypothetical protein
VTEQYAASWRFQREFVNDVVCNHGDFEPGTFIILLNTAVSIGITRPYAFAGIFPLRFYYGYDIQGVNAEESWGDPEYRYFEEDGFRVMHRRSLKKIPFNRIVIIGEEDRGSGEWWVLERMPERFLNAPVDWGPGIAKVRSNRARIEQSPVDVFPERLAFIRRCDAQ